MKVEYHVCDWCKQSSKDDKREWYRVRFDFVPPLKPPKFGFIDDRDMCPECFNEFQDWAPKWNVRSASQKE